MTYKFKYKKRFFWKTIKNAKGHLFIPDANRMDIFMEDGILSLSNWDKYDIYLGSDFLLFQKDEMEKEAGQNIKVQGVQ